MKARHTLPQYQRTLHRAHFRSCLSDRPQTLQDADGWEKVLERPMIVRRGSDMTYPLIKKHLDTYDKLERTCTELINSTLTPTMSSGK